MTLIRLFRLNALEDPNPGDSLYNHRIHSRYYSPYSFYKFKSELPSRVSDSSFSLLHNNIRSLKRNLENFQVHLLDELNFEFSIIGVSETKIISGKEMDVNPRIPGYDFEYVPTPLASGGVGLYVNDSLKYTVIEKVCDEAFQSLSKSNFRRKATSFVISSIDNITLPNSRAAKTSPSFDVLF